jgi:competence protein ComFB
MARRDNKTEHVMKLITKNGNADDGDAGFDDAPSEADTDGIESVETSVSRAEGSSLNYKTKLKIEIEPEVEVLEPAFRRPGNRSVLIAPRETEAPLAGPGAEASDDALRREDDPELIPDGIPYESPDEYAPAPLATPEEEPASAPPAPAPLAAPEEEPVPAPAPPETLAAPAEDIAPAVRGTPEKEEPSAASVAFAKTIQDEVKALREADIDTKAEQRRATKIQIENSLQSKSRCLINLSEMLTKEMLPSVMERMDVCTCPVCTGNVLALALNTLPTKYVTTDAGKQYTQLEVYKRQYELDVMAALTRACLRVKNSPRHEIIDDLD